MHITKLNPSAIHTQRRGFWLVLHLGRLFQQAEHFRHIHQRLSNFPVNKPQEIQRHHHLHDIGIHRDKAANTYRARRNPLHRHQHNDHHGGVDDQSLPDVDHPKRIGGLQRRCFIALHRSIVTRRLSGFCAEIFHCLEIQKRINRLLIGVIVLIIHLFANFDPPFGDNGREPHIGDNRHSNHNQITQIEKSGQGAGNQHQLQDQGTNRKQ